MERFEPFGLCGFSSWGRVGVVINAATWGVPFWHLSHIAVAARHPDRPELLLCESTTLADSPCIIQGRRVAGVQWHPIAERIRAYKGLVWYYRPRSPLYHDEAARLSEFLAGMTGRHYDTPGALGARDWLLAALVRWGRPADLSSLFCSELCAAAGQMLDRFPPGDNASGFSPNRLARKAVICWKSHRRPVAIKRRPCPCPPVPRPQPTAPQ